MLNSKTKAAKNNKSETPALDAFSRNLTQLAKDGLLDPVIGREPEVERVIQILGRKKKNNPVLIGEPGVGKTAIAEGLALKIAQGAVPEYLEDKKVYELLLTTIVAGTKYRGEFEARMQKIMDEVLASKGKILLFVDELHTIVGSGSGSGSLDGANILKPSLARGEMHVIGATTFKEYREVIEKDGALARRFEKVTVDEPSIENVKLILKGAMPIYEKFHKVSFSDVQIDKLIKLSSQYLPYKYFPDKAFDMIDEVASLVKMTCVNTPPEIKKARAELKRLNSLKIKAVTEQQYELASEYRDQYLVVKEQLDILEEATDINNLLTPAGDSHILRVISQMSGVPLEKLNEIEQTSLGSLVTRLNSKVIGQDNPLTEISSAVMRSKVGLKNPKKPIGTFLLLGPTGVGKTLTAKVLAKELFGSDENLIRFDMSEYSEAHAAASLVGAPPGYVGYEEGGKLTEAVRKKPYSIVLFDEIEKAHDQVITTLLSLLDEGHLTDKLGRKADFRNTVIILTSNIGAAELFQQDTVGFNKSGALAPDVASKTIMRQVEKFFRPEFLNRLDHVLMYKPLTIANIKEIVNLSLKSVFERTSELNLELTLDESVINWLAEKGWDEKYGARPLERMIESKLVGFITEQILKSSTKLSKLSLSYSGTSLVAG